MPSILCYCCKLPLLQHYHPVLTSVPSLHSIILPFVPSHHPTPFSYLLPGCTLPGCGTLSGCAFCFCLIPCSHSLIFSPGCTLCFLFSPVLLPGSLFLHLSVLSVLLVHGLVNYGSPCPYQALLALPAVPATLPDLTN